MDIVEFATKNGNHYLKSYYRKSITLLHPAYVLTKEKLCNQGEIEHQESKKRYFKKHGFYNKVDLIKRLNGKMQSKDIECSIPQLKHICFELTEKCNLNCSYCVYEGMYNGRRQQNFKSMDFKIIKNTIDFLEAQFRVHNRTSRIIITFYGGEPLLEFEKIKNTIKYIKQINFNNLNVQYRITTNGILLSKYIKFLVDNNFFITVSLDGDYKHNQYRVFRGSGKPSFFFLKRNIDIIKHQYKDFFSRNITFHSVFHNLSDIDEIYNFFNEEYQKLPSMSQVDRFNISKKFNKKFNELYSNLYDAYRDSKYYNISDKKVSKLSFDFDSVGRFVRANKMSYTFYDKLDYLNNKKTNMLPTSTCSPFLSKMFVTSKGLVLPCEKIPQIHSFGKVTLTDVKIDTEQIAVYMNNLYAKVIKQCWGCYNYDNCGICILVEMSINKCTRHLGINDMKIELSRNIEYLERHPHNYKKITKNVAMI